MTTGFVNGAVSVDDAATSRTNLGTPSTTGSGASGTWAIDISGNAATATSSTSAASVAAANLTGTTLASNVVTSSLTSVGTLAGVTITNGGYIRTQTSSSGSVLFRAGSVAGGGYITMATLSGGAGASLAFTQPSTSTLTWDGGAIGSTTPASGAFTTLSASTSINASFLTASNVVATDGSKNFTSLTYSQSATNSALVQRDISGGITGNIFFGTRATFSPAGSVSAPTSTTTINAVTSSTFQANIVLTGTAYAGNSSTDGIALGMNYNSGGNRQFSIADSAALSSSATQAQVRIIPLGGSAGGAVEAIGMDGSTALPLLLNTFSQGPVSIGSGRFTTTGIMSKTGQPCFLVHQTSDLTGLTKSADITITWNTEIFDQNNNFSSNTFTAPVTGRYLFNINAITPQNFNSATRFFSKFVTSNRTYTICNYNPTALNPSDNLPSFGSSIIADMDAADTATIVTFCSGGTSTYDINGDQESPYWSGCLLA